jgi:hypothetical protein
MKLLISSYACAPNRGSEHAVGWNWVTHAHRLGHEVWALVAPNHENSISRTCKEHPELAGIAWLFPKVFGWPLKQAIEPEWERTYNLLWQASATRAALKLHTKVGFDVVHHLTWGASVRRRSSDWLERRLSRVLSVEARRRHNLFEMLST